MNIRIEKIIKDDTNKTSHANDTNMLIKLFRGLGVENTLWFYIFTMKIN